MANEGKQDSRGQADKDRWRLLWGRRGRRQCEPGDRECWRVEGARDGEQSTSSPAPRTRSLLWLILIAAILVNLMFAFAMSDDPTYTDVPYTVFRQQVGQGNVAEVTSQGDTIQGYFREAVPTAEASDPDARSEAEFATFQTQRPAFADDQLLQMLIENDVTVNAQPLDEGPPLW